MHRTLADGQRSIYSLYCEVICNIDTIIALYCIGTGNIICIGSRICLYRALCGITADRISYAINHKRISHYSRRSMLSSVIGKCSGICR